MYTVEQFKSMSQEEKDAAITELSKEAFKKFLKFHLAKWAVIFGTTYLLRRWIESLPEK